MLTRGVTAVAIQRRPWRDLRSAEPGRLAARSRCVLRVQHHQGSVGRGSTIRRSARRFEEHADDEPGQNACDRGAHIRWEVTLTQFRRRCDRNERSEPDTGTAIVLTTMIEGNLSVVAERVVNGDLGSHSVVGTRDSDTPRGWFETICREKRGFPRQTNVRLGTLLSHGCFPTPRLRG